MINHRPHASPFIILSIVALIAMLVIDISAQNDNTKKTQKKGGGMSRIGNDDLFSEPETGSPNTAVPNTANPVAGNTGTVSGAPVLNGKKLPEKDSASKDSRTDATQANREVREITPATTSGDSSIEIVRPSNQTASANSNDQTVSKNLASSDFRQNAKQILPALAGLAIFVFIAFAFVIFKLLGKLREE